MTTIIDYGLGNVNAFVNVFHRLNIPTRVAKSVDDLAEADRLILPGVGHFDHAISRLNASGMRDEIDRMVRADRTPVLGVCVGMQLLGTRSQEGVQDGLGWIDGHTEHFQQNGATRDLSLPHMGWNDVQPARSNPLFAQMDEAPRFYFLHSFVFRCADESDVLATTTYGDDFCCALHRGNVYGVQFHPEKSHHFGASLLKGFSTVSRA